MIYLYTDPEQFYFGLIFAALILSLIGDIFLALPKKYLIGGIAAFLGVQIIYLIAFALSFKAQTYGSLLSGAVFAAAYLYYRRIRNSLGELRIPVIIYIIIVSTMVTSALLSLFDANVHPAKAYLVAGGATLFYISDMCVAWDRFVKPFDTHVVEYTFYYAAQHLIVFSTIL